MNNFYKLISLGFALVAVFSVNGVSAELKYYTFKGEVDIISDDAGYVAEAGINVGDPVKYYLAIDLDAQGTITEVDGTVNIIEDSVTTWLPDQIIYNNSFYVDIIDKGLIHSDSDYYDTGLHEYNIGDQAAHDYYDPSANDWQKVSMTTDNFINIARFEVGYRLGLDINTVFVLGEEFKVEESARQEAYVDSKVYSTVTITEISDTPPYLVIEIDVQPKRNVNVIQLNAYNLIPVAILGSESFDATQVNPDTVTFGPSNASPAGAAKVNDVNGDGFPDMQLKFPIEETGIQCDDKEATLSGETHGGQMITGSDKIRVRCNGPRR